MGSSIPFPPPKRTEELDLMKAFLHGFWVLVKNLIFFAPRRQVEIEFSLPDQPLHPDMSPLEINQNWKTFTTSMEKRSSNWFPTVSGVRTCLTLKIRNPMKPVTCLKFLKSKRAKSSAPSPRPSSCQEIYPLKIALPMIWVWILEYRRTAYLVG